MQEGIENTNPPSRTATRHAPIKHTHKGWRHTDGRGSKFPTSHKTPSPRITPALSIIIPHKCEESFPGIHPCPTLSSTRRHIQTDSTGSYLPTGIVDQTDSYYPLQSLVWINHATATKSDALRIRIRIIRPLTCTRRLPRRPTPPPPPNPSPSRPDTAALERQASCYRENFHESTEPTDTIPHKTAAHQ